MGFFNETLRIEDVFCKVLAKNDDSGRHGVLIPVHAYRMFPEFSQFDPSLEVNYEEAITTFWKESKGWIRKASKWKHYHRYPERRMTSLSPELLNNKEEGSLLIVAKYKGVYEYECYVIPPSDPRYGEYGAIFKLPEHEGLLSGTAILPYEEFRNPKANQENLEELIVKLNKVNQLGYVSSMKNGDTGVGYTFETLIGIRANSNKVPDYKGIEIKCSRSRQIKGKRKALTGKQTLFSLIPNWHTLLGRKELIETFGVEDTLRERLGLYCTIKIKPNSYRWNLEVNEKAGKIFVCHEGKKVLYYEFEDLKVALEAKHNESVFITAHSLKEKEAVEQFHYDSAYHCNKVSFKEFISLINENQLGLDFAIHSKNGKVRDHGFLWRLDNKKNLFRLFKTVQELL
jgi:hypothetical protein